MPRMAQIIPLPRPAALPSATTLPLLLATVPAGFPSPAADYEEGRLDLTELLIRHPAATFLMRVKGESMRDAGILDGDLLIVDRSIPPVHGHIVVAGIDGDLTVKRLRRQGRRAWLVAANPDFPPIEITDREDAVIFGVAAHAVHHLLKG
ncbi:MAG: translesion error-prone DNA polymerase V autoproteolytic subunit [Ferrovibrio sp.]|nr:translesion error-prone DNA polymerase V autoproteolytic subunit [Ferrovibrio sp.]